MARVQPPRRFPPPWSIVENPESFVITDANGQALTTSISRTSPAAAGEMKQLTRDEARRIAANIAKLPEFPETIKATSAAMAAAISWSIAARSVGGLSATPHYSTGGPPEGPESWRGIRRSRDQ
jgi:hypothetical protein